MLFTVASYNILADSYIKPARYPATDAQWLDPARRHPVLVERIAGLAADVVCLQEVEADVFSLIDSRLIAAGYQGKYARKGAGKPEGCATFIRDATLSLGTVRTLHYADGGGSHRVSGHVALVTVVEHEGRQTGIANTHLKWDPPGTVPEKQVGLRQIRELLDARAELAPGCANWVICGDLNATPESALVQLLQATGLRDAYAGQPRAFTCCANGQVSRIDYLFHSHALVAEPAGLPVIDSGGLPSAHQPSDHLAIGARIRVVAPA